jgi:hypothetical protein
MLATDLYASRFITRAATLDQATLVYTGTSDITIDLSNFSSSFTKKQSTGVLSGGVLSINADDTKYDISDGDGVIVNPVTGMKTNVTWSGLTAQSTAYVGILTFVSISSAGTPVYSAARPTNSDIRDNIYLGVLVHVNGTNIDAVNNQQMSVLNSTNQLYDLSRAVGFVNLSGNGIASSGTALRFQKAAGTMYAFGANYLNDIKDPSTVTTGLVDTNAAGVFQYRNQDGTSSALTLQNIIPNVYDNGGAYNGATPTVSNNNWTIQHVFLFTSNNVKIQMGQTVYANKDAALAAISVESFVVEPSIASNGLLIGLLVVRGGATNLSNTNDAVFIQANKFGTKASGGGTGGVNTMQDTFDNSTDPQIVTTATNPTLVKRSHNAARAIIDQIENSAGTVVQATYNDGSLVVGGTGTTYPFEVIDTQTSTAGSDNTINAAVTVTAAGASSAIHSGITVGKTTTGAVNYTGASRSVNITSQNSSTGTLQEQSGVRSFVRNASTGTCNFQYGYATSLGNSGAGIVGDLMGLFVQSPANAGTITNAFGVYIQDQDIGTTTSAFGVYQQGATTSNYFAGAVGVGTANPGDNYQFRCADAVVATSGEHSNSYMSTTITAPSNSSATISSIYLVHNISNNASNYTDINYMIRANGNYNGTGTVSNLWGCRMSNTNTNTGTITSARNYVSSFSNTSTGAVTELVHYNIDTLVNAGTVTAAYGLVINDLSAATTSWGVFQSSANDNNYFAGDVRIGTVANLGDPLTVQGNAAGAQTIIRMTADDGGNCILLGKNATDDGNIQITDGSEVVQVKLDANGNSYFTGGNVGIGTTSPDYLMHIATEGLPQIILEDSNQADATKPFAYLQSSAGIFRIGHGNRTAAFPDGILTGSADIITITAAGNVGISNSNGFEKLDVTGNVAFGTSAISGVKARLEADINGEITIKTGNVNLTEQDIIFQASNSSGSLAEKMRLTGGGNLGIGTDTPSYKIHMVAVDNGASLASSEYRSERYSTNAAACGRVAIARSRGTVGAAAAVNSADLLSRLDFIGHDGTSFATGAAIHAAALENWGGAAHGSDLKFYTTPTGSTTNKLNMYIGESTVQVESDVNLCLGTDATLAKKQVIIAMTANAAIITGMLLKVVNVGGLPRVEVIGAADADATPLIGISASATTAAGQRIDIAVGGMFLVTIENGVSVSIGDLMEKSDTPGQDGRATTFAASVGSALVCLENVTGNASGSNKAHCMFKRSEIF